MTASIIGLVLVALQVASIFAAAWAVRTARTPQGAVGWVIFLLSAPHFALPVYLLLGHSRFPGYVVERRTASKVSDALRKFGRTHRAHDADREGQPGNAMNAFEAMSDMPLVSGNSAQLLIDGDATFGAILSEIRSAKSYVLVQFYILRDDAIGRDLKDALIEKAQSGCTVRVLYDAIGSHSLPKSYLADLARGGVTAKNFHSIRQPRSRLQVNFRNHRKIVIVDGDIGFVGGLNVGDEYMGRDPEFGHWRDTHMRLAGPVVAQLQLVFLEDWFWATNEQLDLNWSPPRQDQDQDALVVPCGPADPAETGALYFCNAINAARHRLWIASPYFVPDTDILRALQLAALRGVDVRIIVADKRDHWLVWMAAFDYFDELAGSGIQILRYGDGFMHQKVVLVDDSFASVGTINLDNRSCRLNFEVTVVVAEPEFTAQVAQMLEADFARARPNSDRAPEYSRLVRKVGAPFARLFAPIL